MMRLGLSLIVSGLLFATPVFAQTSEILSLREDFATAKAERAAGQFDKAVLRLRGILRAAPDDIGVREELAYNLLLDQQLAAAQFHFEILADQTPDPERKAIYLAVLAKIVRDRPYGIGLNFQIVPSTNVNSGSSQDQIETTFGTLTIDETSRSQNGFRLELGANGFFRRNLDDTRTLRFDWRALQSVTLGNAEDDETKITGAISFSKEFEKSSVTLSLGNTFEFSSNDFSRTTLSANSVHAVSERDRLTLGLSLTDSTNFDDPEGSAFDTIAQFRYIWGLERQQAVFAGMRLENQSDGRAQNQFTGGFLQVGGRKVLSQGTKIGATASFGLRDFEGEFPGQTFARIDWVQELSLTASDSRIAWRGISPHVTCTFRFTQSNISLFVSDTQECGFVLTRRF